MTKDRQGDKWDKRGCIYTQNGWYEKAYGGWKRGWMSYSYKKRLRLQYLRTHVRWGSREFIKHGWSPINCEQLREVSSEKTYRGLK